MVGLTSPATEPAPDRLQRRHHRRDRLAGYAFAPDGWFFTVDGSEEVPSGGQLIGPTRVEILMGFDVALTTAWALADGGAFAFADGQPLQPPMGGGFPYP